MLGSVIAIMISGFITGGLARLAVPGPDPMPFWLTVSFGIAGSIFGGVVAYAFFGATAPSFPFGFAGAVVLVILYRRFVQHRGITGPEAKAQPTRGWGLKR